MTINDAKNAYTFNIDSTRNIIHYALKGMWDMDDFDRFMKDYAKALTYVKKPWSAIVDVTEQKPSLKVPSDKMNELNTFAVNNGIAYGAIITSSAILKMAINRTVKQSNGLTAEMFDNYDSANEFLKSKGF